MGFTSCFASRVALPILPGLLTPAIFSVVVGKGQQHDFSVFKDSRLLLHPDALLLADSGYQGLHKHHQNSALPVKKKKGQALSAEDKAHEGAVKTACLH